ncbi:glutathione peroxidase [Microlunatus endophyticus]|uniref:Glutathione peroxidase n=1 Tax=Microlunatus endophyticus TaxID=1716077 RepID=A0A917S7Y4_9ACTN|nr:glutathione peroxidase [Microlunatus endophyticus]GGL60961.1 glutathione peroxidase [Microlunatus endophyticus]
MALSDFVATKITGDPVDLGAYQGKVVLVVNTASQCGLTPQYAGLQTLYETYADSGLEILGFPCDQFGHQEPGTEAEIADFCELNYGVSFPMFAKIEVNGERAHPLYQWLTSTIPGENGPDIEWNFAKFLLNRDGELLQRYSPQVKPEELTGDLEKALH